MFKKRNFNNKLKIIKLLYKTEQNLTTLLKQYSSVVRYSYNFFIEFCILNILIFV